MKKIILPRNTAYTNRNVRIYPTQMNAQSFGRLRVRCMATGFVPIENASVNISYPNTQDNVIESLTTNAEGLTDIVQLPAPPREYSLDPNSDEQPYATYDITITAEGFKKAVYSDVEIFADTTAIHDALLEPLPPATGRTAELFVISPHTLYADYPPKIPEAEIKPVDESGEIVLSQVVIPEYVIVHDGPPTSPASNYWVKFRDYIKNVASSEIYATWPEATLYANILAILSFTLNRVYTEWYRNQGFNFTITSSTAYDHMWIRGRNFFDNISFVVDSIFNNYLSRPNVRQPILTQYCDGNRVQCPGWLSQWGSKTLGDQGYTAIEILRYYYGDSIFISTAEEVSGVPMSWPGSELTIGSTGDSVRTIQDQLNTISNNFPAIPKIAVDGSYGPKTSEAVKTFQGIFGLPETGVVDFPTWYKISHIYVGVTRIAE